MLAELGIAGTPVFPTGSQHPLAPRIPCSRLSPLLGVLQAPALSSSPIFTMLGWSCSPPAPPEQPLLSPVHPLLLQLSGQMWEQAVFEKNQLFRSQQGLPAFHSQKSQSPTPTNFPGLCHMPSTGLESSRLSMGGQGG